MNFFSLIFSFYWKCAAAISMAIIVLVVTEKQYFFQGNNNQGFQNTNNGNNFQGAGNNFQAPANGFTGNNVLPATQGLGGNANANQERNSNKSFWKKRSQ